jgi:Cu/Ag efflux pump CusA
VRPPPDSYLEWGGQFENLQQAVRRLEIVVPACLTLIFAVLYMALGSTPLALTVFTGVPLALAGGVFSIALRGMPFSISAAVGFIAVSGVAVLNGLVLMASIQRRLQLGEEVNSAILRGALERVLPVLMTALVASLGPNGNRNRNGSRGSAAPCHRGHRRPHHLDGANLVRFACDLRSGPAAPAGGRERTAGSRGS